MSRVIVDVPTTTITLELRGVRAYRVRMMILGWFRAFAGWIGGDQIGFNASIVIGDDGRLGKSPVPARRRPVG